jgi:hypothetical protein
VADPLKARVHLIVILQEGRPFSFRTDVLVPVRDPKSAHDQAIQHARYSLDACDLWTTQYFEPVSLEWIELHHG